MKPEYERQMDELYSAMCEFPGPRSKFQDIPIAVVRLSTILKLSETS